MITVICSRASATELWRTDAREQITVIRIICRWRGNIRADGGIGRRDSLRSYGFAYWKANHGLAAYWGNPWRFSAPNLASQARSRRPQGWTNYADVAELADAIALGAIGVTLGGSNPFVRIIK